MKKKRITICVPPNTISLLDKAASLGGRSRSAFVDYIVHLYFDCMLKAHREQIMEEKAK